MQLIGYNMCNVSPLRKLQLLSFIRFELLSFEHGNPISHKM